MRPRVIIHNAVSLDGRIDDFSPDVDRFYQIASEWHEDGTIAGCDTLLEAPDQPRVEEDVTKLERGREEPPAPPASLETADRRPLLIVPDCRGRLRTWRYWLSQPYWRAGIALVSATTPGEYIEYLERLGIEFILAGEDHVNLPEALKELFEDYNARTLRLDSGGTLSGIMLSLGLVDEVSLLIHPVLVGGENPRCFLRGPEPAVGQLAAELRLKSVEQFEGGLLWVVYDVVKHV